MGRHFSKLRSGVVTAPELLYPSCLSLELLYFPDSSINCFIQGVTPGDYTVRVYKDTALLSTHTVSVPAEGLNFETGDDYQVGHTFRTVASRSGYRDQTSYDIRPV
jgi:hypothetical protein